MVKPTGTHHGPAISIIVPVFNVQGHIKPCLDSLRAQSFSDFECLVVDDGSTDDSRARVLESIEGDPRFQLISQENKGLSAARNIALEQVRGQAIAFVDGDDRVMCDFLAKMWDALCQSNADWVACGLRFVFPDGAGHTHSAIHTAPDLANRTAVTRYPLASWQDVICHFPSAWNKLYRTELIKDLRFTEGQLFEDHAFYYQVAARTDHILHLPEPLYLQTRDRVGQITGSDTDGVFQQFAVLDDLKDILQAGTKPDAAEAFAQIASRLIFERTSALHEPNRRKRYALAASEYLARHSIEYDDTWSDGIGAYWALEMAGKLPLSIILLADEGTRVEMRETINALRDSYLPAHEILIAGTSSAISGLETDTTCKAVQCLTNNPATARRKALALATGHVVVFLQAGDIPKPGALAKWTDRILRDQAALCLAQKLSSEDEAGLELPVLQSDGSIALRDAHGHPLSAMAFDRIALNAGISTPRMRDPLGVKLALRAVTKLTPVALVDEPTIQLVSDRVAPTLAPQDQTRPQVSNAFDKAYPFYRPTATRLILETDLSVGPYTNISFLPSANGNIPFHVSLRRNEQIIVTNQRDNGIWGRENQRPFPLPNGPVNVDISFTDNSINVNVDGKEVVSFDTPNETVLNFNDITVVDIHGAIVATQILAEPVQKDALFLDLSWELRADVSQTDVMVGLVGTDVILSHTVIRDGQSSNLACLLPGRIWTEIASVDELVFSLLDKNANTIGTPLTLSKSDVAHRISALAQVGGFEPTLFEAAHIVEHVHFGQLWELLNIDGQMLVQKLAAQFGVQESMSPCPPSHRPHHPTATNWTDASIDGAVRRFWSAIGTTGSKTIALKALSDLALPPVQRRGLFLAVTEFFTLDAQDFASLNDMAKSENLLPHLTPYDPTDAWMTSVLVPWQLHAGRHWDAVDGLNRLNTSLDGWAVTPAIAYAARFALDAIDLEPDIRNALVFQTLEFMANEDKSYWGRAQCSELAKAAAKLVVCGPVILPEFKKQVENTALNVYGLNQYFWSAIADADLSPFLDQARTAFNVLENASASQIDRKHALDHLDQFGVADVSRYRREYFGPEETPLAQTQGLSSADVLSKGQHASSVALRVAASPEHDLTDDAVDLTRQAVLDGYTDVPTAPEFSLQRKIHDAFLQLIQDATKATPLPDALPSLLEKLARTDSHALAPAMALHAAVALQIKGAIQTAQELVEWVENHLGDDPKTGLTTALKTALNRAENCAGLVIPPAFHLAGSPTQQPIADAIRADGLHDALVLIFSCKPYLETRIPPIRRGWIEKLKSLGIPYLIVVGDGEGKVDGDVLSLDAPDDYEGLPQKTLAALAWTKANTNIGHIVKIDDDCFVNAPVWFGNLSYLKFDYFGRRLTRVPGQTDRSWHREKSKTARGRNELDKSPEPSEYADGGSGYALSRYAIDAVLEQSKTPEGLRLLQVSFMEDKLLGDLLALQNIRVHNEDYRVSIRRKTHSDAEPVAAWLNSFFASQTAPISLVHLDSSADQETAMSLSKQPGLYPAKIWPTHQIPRLGHNSNALELLSPPKRLKNARDAKVSVVAAMRNEIFMLPHFLKHYRDLGVSNFLIADNLSNDGTREYLLEQPDVCLFSVDTDYRHAHFGVDWQQAMLAAYRVGKWSIVADADELLVWQHPQTASVNDLIAQPEFEDADAVRLFMLDMYPKTSLNTAKFETGDLFAEAHYADYQPFHNAGSAGGPFSDQPGWVSALRHRLLPRSRPNLFSAQKLALLRYHPGLRLSEGLHFIGGARIAERELILAHFKYNSAFLEKAQSEVARQQHFNDAEEYRRYLALVAEGRDVIYDPTVSVPWYSAPFIAARLDNKSE
ncbi:MAG: glycosyltransferase [Paracoccaceae bacterium]